ncbi:unnamed protein product [Paramecium sonneborni]|uniref:Uncharacterized protein n=1 Tax=Paramecium sonneborni TaxID=65129 RepID=A0A8S1RRX4_9CILI|nr:unnamed protein product [Paramecium sonneborni]
MKPYCKKSTEMKIAIDYSHMYSEQVQFLSSEHLANSINYIFQFDKKVKEEQEFTFTKGELKSIATFISNILRIIFNTTYKSQTKVQEEQSHQSYPFYGS